MLYVWTFIKLCHKKRIIFFFFKSIKLSLYLGYGALLGPKQSVESVRASPDKYFKPRLPLHLVTLSVDCSLSLRKLGHSEADVVFRFKIIMQQNDAKICKETKRNVAIKLEKNINSTKINKHIKQILKLCWE